MITGISIQNGGARISITTNPNALCGWPLFSSWVFQTMLVQDNIWRGRVVRNIIIQSESGNSELMGPGGKVRVIQGFELGTENKKTIN